jgi:hypothetical protein
MARRTARSGRKAKPTRRRNTGTPAARLLDLGALRWALFLCTLFLIVFAPPAGAKAAGGGWSIFSTIIMPALVPLFFMVLLLDALMSAVFLKGTHRPEQRPRYRLSVAFNLVLVVALVIAWYPFFAKALF